MASNFPTPMPQSGSPFVDLTTGRLTLEGYRWALNIWSRTGGSGGSNSGAVLQSANNLSDLASVSTSRINLGLGSAATQPSSAFATAAQGALAGTALQPNTSIGVLSVEIGGVRVLGPQIGGWGTPAGGVRGSGAAYAGQSTAASYSQAQAQQTDNAVKAVSQQLMALIADLETQGMIAT